MTRIFIAILLITFPTLGNAENLCAGNNYNSCTYNTIECYWDGNEVQGTCQQCPPSHPIHKDEGTNKGIHNCYKTCPFKPSCTLPSITPSNASLKETEAYYNSECLYDGVTCDGNYHANTTTGCCDPNVKNSTIIKPQNCATAVDIWQGNAYLTFCTECATDYHLENTKTATTTNGTKITYGTCVTNTPLCSAVIETNDTITCTITGNAQWNTDNGKYDYSACTCDTLTQDELGKCGTVYNTWDGTQWTGSEYKCTECIAGACWNKNPNNKCAPAQQGYYSPAPDAKCHKCPAGSTTNVQEGAESLTNCILTPGTTKFCSNNGDCFTLPTNAKTFPASKTPSTQQ